MFVCLDFRVIFVFIFVSEITYFMPGTVYSKDWILFIYNCICNDYFYDFVLGYPCLLNEFSIQIECVILYAYFILYKNKICFLKE